MGNRNGGKHERRFPLHFQDNRGRDGLRGRYRGYLPLGSYGGAGRSKAMEKRKMMYGWNERDLWHNFMETRLAAFYGRAPRLRQADARSLPMGYHNSLGSDDGIRGEVPGERDGAQ